MPRATVTFTRQTTIYTSSGTAYMGREAGGGMGAEASVFLNVQQMGLKLDSGKAPIEILVVDHLEKAPKEN